MKESVQELWETMGLGDGEYWADDFEEKWETPNVLVRTGTMRIEFQDSEAMFVAPVVQRIEFGDYRLA